MANVRLPDGRIWYPRILTQILKLYKCRKCYRTERFDRNNKFPCNTTAVQQHEKNVRRRVDILAGTGSHLY